VNVLTPSLIEGTLTHARMQQDPFASKLFAKARQLANLGVAVADDLAEPIVFLASPQAARLTGQAISLKGGISVRLKSFDIPPPRPKAAVGTRLAIAIGAGTNDLRARHASRAWNFQL
jgi:hypothetical protein